MAQRSVPGGSIYSIHEAYTVDRNRKPAKEQEDARLRILKNQQRAAVSARMKNEAAVVVQKTTEESEDANEVQKWWVRKKQMKQETHMEKIEREVAKRWEDEKKAKEARDRRKINGRQRDQSIQEGVYSSKAMDSAMRGSTGQRSDQNVRLGLKPQLRSNSAANVQINRKLRNNMVVLKTQKHVQRPPFYSGKNLELYENSYGGRVQTMKESLEGPQFLITPSHQEMLDMDNSLTSVLNKRKQIFNSMSIGNLESKSKNRIEGRNMLKSSMDKYLEEKNQVKFTRNASQQQIQEYANQHTNVRLLNQSQQSLKKLESKRAQTSESALDTRPQTNVISSKPSQRPNAASVMSKPIRQSQSPSRLSMKSPSKPSIVQTNEDEDEIMHKPKLQGKYQCAMRACKCWQRIKKGVQSYAYDNMYSRHHTNLRSHEVNSKQLHSTHELDHMRLNDISTDKLSNPKAKLTISNDIPITIESGRNQHTTLTKDNQSLSQKRAEDLSKKFIESISSKQIDTRKNSHQPTVNIKQRLDKQHEPSGKMSNASTPASSRRSTVLFKKASIKPSQHRRLNTSNLFNKRKSMATSQKQVGEEFLSNKMWLKNSTNKSQSDFHQRVQNIKALCNNIIDDQGARTMMRSLDFYGMPLKFNEQMMLYEGERPDRKQAKPQTMAIIDPHNRLYEDQKNPLVKYFDENYGASSSAQTSKRESLEASQPNISGSYSFLEGKKVSAGNMTIVQDKVDMFTYRDESKKTFKKQSQGDSIINALTTAKSKVEDIMVPSPREGKPEISHTQRQREELKLIQSKLREMKRKKRIQQHLDEQQSRKQLEEPDHALLENIVHTGLTEMSAAAANSFLRNRAIEFTSNSPKREFENKPPTAVPKQHSALMQSKKRIKEKYHAKWTNKELADQYEELKRRGEQMTGKVNMLIGRIDEFEENECAYKISRMEITRKARAQIEERNTRVKARDKNF